MYKSDTGKHAKLAKKTKIKSIVVSLLKKEVNQSLIDGKIRVGTANIFATTLPNMVASDNITG